ncbi:alpha/beta fold hydrolase [Hoeflea prorocentri]|uniref:Alpha/beta hydrolase n=1 Tax=Hoeflea prorocentri TaxID=1922333 RepID=A0A9X3UK90_9HYPH|nr:alpha/beta hydrolase [Hoeflea prorocentri]MCY6380391.1 alpha/beta hydrolase [Hoeflea prorocentri]MDA5398191.1 alpha/beta hydrolase [Hoeflea prorocentri]
MSNATTSQTVNDSVVCHYEGAHGNRLAASVYEAEGPPVLFFHGGGQTRHAWDTTARALQKAGRTAIAIDQRGHGDSEWVTDKAYAFDDFAADVASVARRIRRDYGIRPIVIGASLGGISSLSAQYESGQDLLKALVLVDVTPRMRRDGVDRILGFMSDRMEEGFVSLEEAADSIAAYLPNRSRPKSLSGLSKNLRLGDDGRYRWHWDPAFINGPRPVSTGRDNPEAYRSQAARALAIPTLLVRGRQSELVSEEHAEEFLKLVPHAKLADVSGAGHMVAGDRNDIFQAAILEFLETI